MYINIIYLMAYKLLRDGQLISPYLLDWCE